MHKLKPTKKWIANAVATETIPDYSFQAKLEQDIYRSIAKNRNVVLAASPGSGKTRMAISLAERYLKEHPHAKILCLTHGMKFLRTQWAQRLAEAKPCFSHTMVTRHRKKLKPKESFWIALPQTLQNKCFSADIDLLIVDEAHHFYRSPLVQKLIEKFKPKHQLLLTGTPSRFVDDDSFDLHGITISETLKHGILTDPLIELAEYSYEQGLKDYQGSYDLKAMSSITKKSTDDTMDRLWGFIVGRLAEAHRSSEEFDWGAPPKTWAQLAAALKKTMFACASIRQAHYVFNFLKNVGVSCAVSTSKSFSERDEIERFMSEEQCRVLIVVNRGVLGFDYPELMNVVDMTGSFNPNRLFQLLCRVVRPGASSQRKMFIKLTSKDMREITEHAMSFTVAMALPEYYYFAHDSEKIHKRLVPNTFKSREDALAQGRSVLPVDKYLPYPRLMTFSEVVQNKNMLLSCYAHTNFAMVRRKLLGRFTVEDALTAAASVKKL